MIIIYAQPIRNIEMNARTLHRTKVVRELISRSLKRYYKYIENKEEVNLKNIVISARLEEREKSQKENIKKLKADKNRLAVIDRLFVKLYEDNIGGRINDETFNKIAVQYTEEQKTLNSEILELEEVTEKLQSVSDNTEQFIKTIKSLLTFPYSQPR